MAEQKSLDLINKKNKSNTDELTKIAEQKTSEIFNRIEYLTSRLEEAKKRAQEVKQMKTGLFSTDKKVNASTELQVLQTDINIEMNDLIQESIRFTASSVMLAQAMYQNMNYSLLHGFKNTEGEILTLNDYGKKAIKAIMDDIDTIVKNEVNNIKRQASNEKKQQKKLIEMENKHILYTAKSEKKQKNLEKKLREFKKQDDNLINEIQRKIFIHRILIIISLLISISSIVMRFIF
jgi:hypothetical protein